MMDRREFLKTSALASGALLIGVDLSGCAGSQRRKMEKLAAKSGEFAPNMWITITPDDRILVAVEKSEMGQGVLTSHAMFVAEELEVPLERIEAFSADGAPEYRTSFGMQQTGGSTSVKESYFPVRMAAAAAREMLVAAAAAKWAVRSSECTTVAGVVHHAPSGKQASYGELTRVAAEQPIPREPTLKSPADFDVLGTDATRVDAHAKVTGTATFGIDVRVPNMVKAHILRPPVFGSKPMEVDAADAREMEGVVDVITFQRGIAIIAEKYWQARRAARTVEITWGEAELDETNSQAIRALALDAVGGDGTVVAEHGDVDEALERDDVTHLEATYEAPYLAHSPMEPMNCTASVTDDGVEVWAPTQIPTIVQEVGANICDVDRDDVEVHVTFLGGGFGRRGAPDFAAEAIELSRQIRRPVQVIWSREDDTTGGYYRPFSVNRMEGALDRDGHPVAWRYHSVSQPITTDFSNWMAALFPGWMPKVARKVMTRSAGGIMRSGTVADFLAAEGAREIPYGIDNFAVEFTPLQTTVPTCFWRSVGHSYNGFVVESFADELAHAAGEDPFEFRRRHMRNGRLRNVMERAAEEADWGSPRKGYAHGIAAHASFDSYCAEVVEARVVDGEIDVRKVVCVIDCGQAINPDIIRANMESSIIFGMSAALYQKITLKDGRVQQGNFDDYPLLRLDESPDIDVHIIDSPAPPTGVGEPGLPPIAPAIANAIFAGTGIRLRKMPFVDALAEHAEKEGS